MAKFEPKPFGKYFLTDKIAVGGMAEIYKAKTFGVDGFEKVLAIKKILSHYSADKEFITMLTDEAKLVVNLSHSNIVQVYDLGRVNDDYFISMEFIDGINLRDLIERGKEINETVPPDIAIYLASEVCKGLDYAHSKKGPRGKDLNIVHRDVSPQNILVSYDGGIKIVDFGIAKAAMNLSQTHDGILKGKVTYMAPEQAFGKPIDHRTDIFSIGIVLYELLTGERMFTGESQMEILKMIRNTKITEKSFGKNIPKELKPILAKSLSYTVKGRYEHAADMQVALTRVLYLHYNDFTPRRLTDLLQRWFADEIKNKDEPQEIEEIDKETILVSSNATNQINIVHREENKPSISDKDLPDTVKPEDGVKPDDFSEEEKNEEESSFDMLEGPEVTETTERSEVTSPHESVENMLEEKRKVRASRKAPIIALLFILIAAGTFLYYRYGEDIIKKYFAVDPIVEQTVSSVSISSVPVGAAIFMDDKNTGLVTPVKFENLEIGKVYQIKLIKEGFEQIQTALNIGKDNDPINLTLQMLLPNSYVMNITSEPSGAVVIVDGEVQEILTPARIENLNLNQTYKLVLKHDGHKIHEQSFINSKPEDQAVDIKLEALPKAELMVETNPVGAEIYINNEKTEYLTPHTFDGLDFPQSLDITFKKEGYEDKESKISLEKDDAYSVKETLKKKIVLVPVLISSNIKGAQIVVNKKSYGKTPNIVMLAPGTYKVLVRISKYKEETKNITVIAADKKKSVYFKLIKKQQPTPVTIPPIVKDTTIKSGDTNYSKTAKLRVDSSPRGASVKINGVARGITPIVISGLAKNKSMKVTVSKPGHKTWTRSIVLSRDKTELKANL